MRDLKEYFREHGLSEKILNNPAFDDLISGANTIYSSASEWEIESGLNASFTIKDRDKGNDFFKLHVDAVLHDSVTFFCGGYERRIQTGTDGKLKVVDISGSVWLEPKGEYSGPAVRYIRDRIFMNNGLEESLIETTQTNFSSIVTKHIIREPNGYLARIDACDYDTKGAQLEITKEYNGYVNLDLRSNEIMYLDSNALESIANGNDYLGQLPVKIESLPESTTISEEGKEYINRGINDNSDEEMRKWETIYAKPFEVKDKEPIRQQGRTMGFAKVWILGLITGVVATAITIFGIVLIK